MKKILIPTFALFLIIQPILSQIDTNFSTMLGSGFDPTAVGTLAVQKDGDILVGGVITAVDGVLVARDLVRLKGDGSPDFAFSTALGVGFDAAASRNVSAIVLEPDGQILVGGFFTTFDNQDIPDHFIRLNSNGTVDATFSGALGTGFNARVSIIALRANGQILVGGYFTNLNGNDVPDKLVQLHPNGSVDTNFSAALGTGFSGFDNFVGALALQPDDKVLVGGGFTDLNNQNVPGCLVRLNANGSLDTNFSAALGTGFNDDVFVLVVQPDNKILVGGAFFGLNGNPLQTPDELIRLNADGSIDTNFSLALGSGFSGSAPFNISRVFALSLCPGGQIFVGGNFTNFNNTDIPDHLVQLDANGNINTNFSMAMGSGFNSNGEVSAFKSQVDGKLLVGGRFTMLNNQDVPDLMVRLIPAVGLLTNLDITPINPSLLTNMTLQFFATGQYSGSGSVDMTSQVTWTSTVSTVASVNSAGLATALSPGTTTIRAAAGVILGQTFLTVTNELGIGIGLGTLFNSGDFTGDSFPDILVYKPGKTGGLKLIDVSSNAMEAIRLLEIPTKGKLLAGNRVAGHNYLAFKTSKTITIWRYNLNDSLSKNGDLAAVTLPKEAGKVKASGDINLDGVLDLISVKGKNVNVIYGPGYTTVSNISSLTSISAKRSGKIVSMYSTNGNSWVLVSQKGKLVSSYIISTNFSLTPTSSINVNGKIRGMSGAIPITQKGKIITAGSFRFTNSKTNNLGKAIGPK